jgi:DNA-binding FadR family transcriptional regulator
MRLAVELGVALLAAERAPRAAIGPLEDLVDLMERSTGDYPAFRRADVRFHIGLADAAGSPPLVAAMTEAHGALTDVLHHIPHPPEVLVWSNAQHARLLACLERHDAATATRVMSEHVRATEHVLAGLLPAP